MTHYTPRNDGIAGLEEFGDIEHGTNYKPVRPVNLDGVRMVGPTFEPELVGAYLARGGKITKCPTRWATGATRFSAGWSSRASIATAQAHTFINEDGDAELGTDSAGTVGRTVRYGADEE